MDIREVATMLVLTRKVGDRIWIGDQICITVVHTERGKVRVGIDAPRDVVIRRGELPKTPPPVDPKEPVLITCP
jgi:carbon storage regulator